LPEFRISKEFIIILESDEITNTGDSKIKETNDEG
jgi:hypothetical protein